MILLDWTRMGASYCLAGVVDHGDGYQVVRPLPALGRGGPVRNGGWRSAQLLCHGRWEIFELIDPEPAAPEPPHLEDLWVRSLRPHGKSAPPEKRRAILEATISRDLPFGAPLVMTSSSAYLQPGTGLRSLTTVRVSAECIHFSASRREGAAQLDYRVALNTPELGNRLLPVKDHTLLQRIEQRATDLAERVKLLDGAVREMGEAIAVRLGISRAFLSSASDPTAKCWLMADGFFSWNEPQP